MLSVPTDTKGVKTDCKEVNMSVKRIDGIWILGIKDREFKFYELEDLKTFLKMIGVRHELS